MKKVIFIWVALILVASNLQSQVIDPKSLIDSLTTIDPEIRKYFPRWKLCETDLQIQIYQAFRLAGFDEKSLSKTNIEILAAPRTDPNAPFDLLLITCGESSINSAQMSNFLGDKLINILSGALEFANLYNWFEGKRDYCFVEIPPEIPVTYSQAQAIINFLEPTNATHSITVSIFEQTLKFGESGFWLKNIIGTDEIGYPFWSSGCSKIVLKRPLYVNQDTKTSSQIPFLINAYLGGAYRIHSGINNKSDIFSWVPSQKLNQGPGGKLIAGLDFHMPFHPQFGLHFNMEIPVTQLKEESIDPTRYARYYKFNETTFDSFQVVPLLRSSGQITLFYNLWITKENPENYFRVDLGLDYFEVKELLYVSSPFLHGTITPNTENNEELKLYKPNEFADWLYFKLEYRNQSVWPFGASVQYSNQTLLGRVYIPLFNWLYIEAKVAQIMRTVRPFESKTFFMISPILRITL